LVALPLLLLGSPQSKREKSDTNSANELPASVRRVKLLLDNGAPAVEIVTTMPVNPQISKLDDAMRLVIDLPNTNMSVRDKLVPIKGRDLSELRLSLRDTTPPMVHIEVDFRRPLGFTWDSARNRLLVSFHDIRKNAVSALSPAAAGESPLPVSAPVASAGYANVVPAERLGSGASITADTETTVLRQSRAGEVYVCPQTTVSVMHSRNGPELMLAINGGALETHLTLQNSADEVVTPDFRILLRGPGEFHYAIRADSRGNTCVRALPGNRSPAIIYEMMGDGKFEVQPNDQLVFHGGQLSAADTAFHSESISVGNTILPVDCGCPPPSRPNPTLLASNTAEPAVVPPNASVDPSPLFREAQSDRVAAAPDSSPSLATNPAGLAAPESGLETADLPPSRRQPPVQVAASLTFTFNPATAAGRRLPLSSRQVSSPVAALPPSATPGRVNGPEQHKTVFGKIRHFFSRVFR
jgi:hypothetical protein